MILNGSLDPPSPLPFNSKSHEKTLEEPHNKIKDSPLFQVLDFDGHAMLVAQYHFHYW